MSSSCPASSSCSTHSSCLCPSAYSHYHFACNLPPTFSFLPKHLYSFSDPSHKPTLFVLIASASRVELSFPPPHMPFLSPYFKISASMWFICHITFIFFPSYLISPLHLLQLANSSFWLALNKTTWGVKCWTEAKQAALKAQQHHFVEKVSSSIKKKKKTLKV